MGGISKFNDLLANSMPVDFDSFSPEEREELGNTIINTLFDTGGPRSIDRATSARDKWWGKRLFMPAYVIRSSFEHLQDFEIYIRRFLFGGTRVSPSAYLEHTIHGYFNEVYILRDRMISLLNILRDDYSSHSLGAVFPDINSKICRAIKKNLKEITDARNMYVHKSVVDIAGISRVRSLEHWSDSVFQGEESKGMEKFYGILQMVYEDTYKAERKRWRKVIQSWNTLIESLLNDYFEFLGSVIFTKSGDLIYPMPDVQ